MLAVQPISFSYAAADPYRQQLTARTLSMPDRACWAVADGIGGGGDAVWASEVLLDAVENLAENIDLPFDAAIRSTHRLFGSTAAQIGTIPAASFAGFAIRQGVAHGCWIGNCRIYRLRADTLVRLTRDHSAAEQLAQLGRLEEEGFGNRHLASILTRAVGSRASSQADIFQHDAEPGDRFLLCNSALPRILEEPVIALLLGQSGRLAAARDLARYARVDGDGQGAAAVVVEV